MTVISTAASLRMPSSHWYLAADFIQTVGLDLRYTLGLTDVFDVPDDPEARNQAFIGAVTIGFNPT